MITGESGSGKSIFLTALRCLLGEHFKKSYIGFFSDKVILEACFDCICFDEQEELKKKGWLRDSRWLVCRREFSSKGSFFYIEDKKVKLFDWKYWASRLMHTQSQSDIYSSFSPNQYLNFIDNFSNIKKKFNQFTECYYQFKEAEKRRLSFEERILYLKNNAHQLKIKLKEFEVLTDSIEEYEEILKESVERQKIIENEDKLFKMLSLFEKKEGFLSNYGVILQQLNQLSLENDKIDLLIKGVEEGYESLKEVHYLCSQYFENSEKLSLENEQVEDRLYRIHRLLKKYQMNIGELIVEKQGLKKIIEEEKDTEEQQKELLQEETIFQNKAMDLAKEISLLRKKNAQLLAKKIMKELSLIGLRNVRFSISFELTELSKTGIDVVDFLVSFNLGDKLVSLSSASGGELSRFLFVMKLTLAHYMGYASIVFDEIDSNIGGDAVRKLVQKLKKEKKSIQFICVSHSYIMAHEADDHFKIEKKDDLERRCTLIDICSLKKEEERQKELKLLLGGMNVF